MPVGNNSTVAKPGSRLRELGLVPESIYSAWTQRSAARIKCAVGILGIAPETGNKRVAGPRSDKMR
jgi:hypothetical protein